MEYSSLCYIVNAYCLLTILLKFVLAIFVTIKYKIFKGVFFLCKLSLKDRSDS